MKRLIFLLCFFGLLLFIFVLAKEKVRRDFSQSPAYPTITSSPSLASKKAGPEKQSLFVPYWTMQGEIGSYDSFLYFGVKPTIDGLDTKEIGYTRLDTFLSFVPDNANKFLVVRMIEPETNFAILKDQNAHRKIIGQTLTLAREKGFDGVVLDLEVSAVPFDSLINQITSFTTLFYNETKASNLSFSLTIYGDVFYRLRPFDVKALANNSDQILIMAYDFSKAKGNPGPNFPLGGQDTYGYDYEKMLDDFLQVVPAEKLTIIFGLFGYDWVVDEKGQSLHVGKAITSSEARESFIQTCEQKNCEFARENDASEMQVKYLAKDDTRHIIWFEDQDSVAAKKAYAKSRGINAFSYWAHSYF